ncbi:Hypothetical predicted protein [Paramuricea clavata]|uniref:Helitron helicase-like domain-containing protein n=1 Tax=Paramuricea clavata TaxID=317549 RepID=A0A6S7GM86_PARCT|nr:Hypothetical predicted protein [Paramuricea clavata]
MYEVVAMIKQLGIPTWFMTLSCADLRWPELFQIIARTKGNNITTEEVEALSYHERCSMLNLNPVIVAKHFQYRVETFFRDVLLTNANPIELTNDTKDAYIYYIDQHVQAYLPDKETDPELYDLVKTYQTHNHSKTCRKYTNVTCRFNFGQFFTDRTIVAEPLADDIDDEIKSNILTRRKENLSKVKQRIDDDETECSKAIINAAKEAKEANLNVRDGLRKIGAAFLSTREVIAQECVYRCMPELWLRKIFPKTLFVSTDFAENCVRFVKKQQELDELDDDSTDIFKSNIIIRYGDRPKKIPVVNDMCLALFAAHYFKDYKSDFNEVSDSQPEVLSDDFIESQNIENHNTGLPDRIKLVNSKEIMKCRKLKLSFDITLQTKEKNLKNIFTTFSCYVQEVVLCNKEIFEPDGDAINEALESLRNFNGIPTHSYDPINDQENEDLQQSLPDDSDETESFNESFPQHLASNPESVQPSSGISSYNQPLARNQ